jgi:O-antigen ligase
MEATLNKKFPFSGICPAWQTWACKLASIGFLVYLGANFFLKSSQQKTFFYLLLVLPVLFFFLRARALFQTDRRAMIAFVLFLAYFAISACWGEGTFREAFKLGLLTFCLLLAVKAYMRRFTAEFLADFLVVVGGLAVCLHLLALAVSEGGFSTFTDVRFSLRYSYGWGNGHPIESATLLGLPIIAAWWRFPGRKRLIQILLSMLMPCSFALMSCTQSRGPILAVGATLLLMTLIRRDRSDVFLLASTCVLSSILFLYTNVEEHIQARLMAPSYRIQIWQQVWEQFMAHFWVGQGYGRMIQIPLTPEFSVQYSHSFLLEIFRAGGIIGGGLFFFLLFAMLDRRVLQPAGFFFLLWLIYGMLCLLTNGRLLLIEPWKIEFFAFWIPLLCLYFSTRPVHQNPATPLLSGKTPC